MEKIKPIRAHHLLCLPGYKGINYSPESKNNWDIITAELKINPDMKIKIIDGTDTLCIKCPAQGAKKNKCKEDFTRALDENVKQLLNIKAGEIYPYRVLSEKLKNLLNEHKHYEICGACSWRKEGLCADTFRVVKEEVTAMVWNMLRM